MKSPFSPSAYAEHSAAYKYAGFDRFRCQVHCPAGWKGTVQKGRLPPCAPVPAFDPLEFDLRYLLSQRPGMESFVSMIQRFGNTPGRAVRVVPVDEGLGMWFDFRGNEDAKRHTGVVVDTQGINAITAHHETGEARLEWYDRCPIPAHADRNIGNTTSSCRVCHNSWPHQNFLTNSAQQKPFWLDGWRNGDRVNQFLFTAPEEGRGVAQQMIGEQRFPGIVLSFFTSTAVRTSMSKMRSYGNAEMFGGPVTRSRGILESLNGSASESFLGPEIAGGVEIEQDLEVDPLKAAGWNLSDGTPKRPDALVYIVPLFPRDFAALIASHPEEIRRRQGSPFAGVTMGNR